jgi:hypothetical protein
MRTLSGSELELVVGGQNPTSNPTQNPAHDPWPPGNNNPVTTQDERIPGSDDPDWTVDWGQAEIPGPVAEPPVGDPGSTVTSVTGPQFTNEETGVTVTIGVNNPTNPTGGGIVVTVPF